MSAGVPKIAPINPDDAAIIPRMGVESVWLDFFALSFISS
jgi:hypothetical protein